MIKLSRFRKAGRYRYNLILITTEVVDLMAEAFDYEKIDKKFEGL